MLMDEIKNRINSALPPDGLGLLKAIFLQTESRNKGISAERFQADNYSHIRTLAHLERLFITSGHDNAQQKQVYRLNRVALPVLELERSELLLDLMRRLLPFLVDQYRKNLTHVVLVRDMLKFLDADAVESLEAVSYLVGSPGFSGTSPDFPKGNDAYVCVMQQILEYQTIEKILSSDAQYIGGNPFPVAVSAVEALTSGDSNGDMAVDRQPLSFDILRLHPKIAKAATELFEHGHPWEAVFAASKALVNLVKDKSGKTDLDGAPLMRSVFSRNKPILAFNKLTNQTEQDEQEGMMHLFEGVVLGIRNPGGHSFPEGSEQRALEYLLLISLLAYRTDEATRL